MPSRSFTTLTIAMSSAPLDPRPTARPTASRSTSPASAGSDAIWAAVLGSGSISTPPTVAGTCDRSDGSTSTSPLGGVPGRTDSVGAGGDEALLAEDDGERVGEGVVTSGVGAGAQAFIASVTAARTPATPPRLKPATAPDRRQDG